MHVYVYSDLEKSMRRYFHQHSVVWNGPQGLLEEHRAHQVVDMVLGRGVECQGALPIFFRDRGADPAGRAGLRALNNLQPSMMIINIGYLYDGNSSLLSLV